MQKSGFLHIGKPQIYTQLSLCPHRLHIPTAAKITCSFSLHLPFAASSPSTNRPKSKFRYLAIVSLKHGRLVRVRSQYSLFRRSPTRQNLPPATFDASERFINSLPFSPVQNMAVRVCGTNKFLQKILMHLAFQILLEIPPHGF